MSYQHQALSAGRWNTLSLVEQLANVGSEVIRAIGWKNKGKHDYSRQAVWRAFELLDLTIEDNKNVKRLKEVIRIKEGLGDYLLGDNVWRSNDEVWQNYFMQFTYLARLRAGK